MPTALKEIGRVIMLLVTLGITAAVWYIWHMDGWGLTPERAAKRDGLCENTFILKVQRQSPTTSVVVCQGFPPPVDGAYVYVSRLPWGVWRTFPSGGSFSYQSPEAVSTDLVDYIYTGPTQSVHTTLILLGRSRSPEVTAVEAILSDGRTLKNEVTNSSFVFDAPIQAVGVKVDELRVIGQNNQILQSFKVRTGN
jgi:hypothetical protein